MGCGKDCVENFVDHIEDEVKWLCDVLQLFDMLKRRYAAVEDRDVKYYCRYTCLYLGPSHNGRNLKYWIQEYILILFLILSGYYTHLVLMKLERNLIGIILDLL